MRRPLRPLDELSAPIPPILTASAGGTMTLGACRCRGQGAPYEELLMRLGEAKVAAVEGVFSVIVAPVDKGGCRGSSQWLLQRFQRLFCRSNE